MTSSHTAGPVRRGRRRIRFVVAPAVLLVVLGLTVAALAAGDEPVSAGGREAGGPVVPSAGGSTPTTTGPRPTSGPTITVPPTTTGPPLAEPPTTGATLNAAAAPTPIEPTVPGQAEPPAAAFPPAGAVDAAANRAAPAAVAERSAAAERHDFGTSVEGRALTAWRRAGSDRPTRRELVVGVIHGEEPGGRAITDLLLTLPLPPELELWVVPTLNPDGEAVGQRGNANGVDLNRNFPTGWLPPGSDQYTSGGYHSGPGPASEPEVQAAMALVRSLRPQRTLWYHQPWEVVICEVAHAGRACTDYAARVGLEATSAPRPGSAIGWQQAEDLGAALVVELADGPPPAAVVERHAAAVIAG